MSVEEAERLVSGQTRVRHCDGPEGVYVGCLMSGPMLVLLVEADGQRRQWWADDCEVAS